MKLNRKNWEAVSMYFDKRIFPKILGILLMIGGLSLSIYFFMNASQILHQDSNVELWLGISKTLFIGFYLFSIGLALTIVNKSMMLKPIYDPSKKIVQLTWGVIAIILFLVFILLLTFKHNEIFFFSIFCLTCILVLISYAREYNKYLGIKKFGVTRLKFNQSSYQFGQELIFNIENEYLQKYLKDLEINFRNIVEEKYSYSDKKRRHKYAFNFYEKHKQTKLITHEEILLEIRFTIPNSPEVLPTVYDNNGSVYWEIEILNKDENYRSVFYVEIFK